jgi:acyl-CoA thioester hydrolase
MADAFRVPVTARGYEVDGNGHVAGTVLLQYAQHARWECLRAAGVDLQRLADARLGPVSLEERIRFHSEVLAGDELVVSCRFVWGDGSTFRVVNDLHRERGPLVADVRNVGGLLDLEARRLVADPAGHWHAAATRPDLLGL